MSAYEMPQVGDLIAGKYRLEKVAGEGGMGLVYAAEHLVLKQRVAVKVLLPDAAQSEAVVERFAREAQAAARIQSEHVARVMDAGSTAKGAPFLVMEYLEGCDLEELLHLQGPLPVTEVVDYLLQALEALAHAHAVGLVHRDLKPANLFLACRPDGGNVIKILDFGISKAVKATREEKVLTGQAVLGSPMYMSPEQLRNAKELDARADLWSLGVVAYELLTGKPPFDGDGVGEIFAAVLEKTAEPACAVNPKVPLELSQIIARCLERRPEDRWSDAAELSRALSPFGSGAWEPVVERIEQVLARSKMLSFVETPMEARRVVDALAAAAERARTTGGNSAAFELALKKIGGAGGDVGGAGGDAPTSVRGKSTLIGAETREEVAPRGKGFFGRSSSRWLALAAGLLVVVGALGTAAAVRAGRPASAQVGPAPGAASSADPNGKPGDQGTSGNGQEQDPDDAPMVMDLKDTPGQNGSARRRGPKSGKPQRPKFLNSRE